MDEDNVDGEDPATDLTRNLKSLHKDRASKARNKSRKKADRDEGNAGDNYGCRPGLRLRPR